MALLPQSAKVPFSPFRLGIPVDSEGDAALSGHSLSTTLIKRSTIPSPFARNISLNPVRGLALRTLPFAENQVATFYDQDYEIRGIVKDSSGAPMQRRVIVLTRDGTRLGITRSLPDGTFKIRTTGYLLNRTISLAIADDGDLRNAVVKWGAVPVTPYVQDPDPYYSDVRLLLRSSFQSSGSSFQDESVYATVYTGTSLSVNNSIVKYGTGSIAGGGGTCYIEDSASPTPTSSRWSIAGAPLTIEAWVYWTPTGLQGFEVFTLWGSDGGSGFHGFTFGVLGNGVLFIVVNGTSIDFASSGSFGGSNGAIPTNEWVHIAAVYDGSHWTHFINGVPGAKRYAPWNLPAQANVRFLSALKGYADDVRLTANNQRYPHRTYPNLSDLSISTYTPFTPPSQLPNF